MRAHVEQITWLTYIEAGDSYTVEVGFYESGFYEPSPLMNFFSIPLRFPISFNIQNVGFYELRFL